MQVTIKGEGNQSYPVLARNSYGILTLGMPDGGVRDVDERLCVQVPDTLTDQG